jgi:hypothetical protein
MKISQEQKAVNRRAIIRAVVMVSENYFKFRTRRQIAKVAGISK